MVDRIRKLCKENGTSITKLEAALGFGNGAIGKWGKAKSMPPADKLLLVADALNVTVDYLLGNESEKPTAGGDELTKDEETVIQLLRQVPEEQRELVLNMIEAALKTQGLLD